MFLCFPDGSHSKESARNAGDASSIPGLGRSPGVENGNPQQYSYLQNPRDRGDWLAMVHGHSSSLGLEVTKGVARVMQQIWGKNNMKMGERKQFWSLYLLNYRA